jgi:triosephosphate isomerase (TIM)
MKKLFIVANWKSYKTTAEANEWLLQVESNIKNQESSLKNKKVIVCPPYTLLPGLKNFLAEHVVSIQLGAQDISPFEEGSYTGEVNAKQLKEFAAYTIIGHSERRDNFKEDDALLAKKVSMATKYNLEPIYCVQGIETTIPDGVKIVAYEPVFAIGTGTPDTPENAEQVIKAIKAKHHVPFVLYGGSVNDKNVHTFTSMPSIDGVLVGGASLDAEKFVGIIKNS